MARCSGTVKECYTPLLVFLVIFVILCIIGYFVQKCFEDKVDRFFMKKPKYKSKNFFNITQIKFIFNKIFILVKVNIDSEQHPPGNIFYPAPIDKSEV